MRGASALLLVGTVVASCGKGSGDSGAASGGGGGAVVPDGGLKKPCTLPGSVLFTASGTETVPGGSPDWGSLAYLHLPVGFCAHYFGNVGDARQLRFAPGGELFVSSPTGLTTGGASQSGAGAIMVLPDDNLDGVADSTITFLQFTGGAIMGTTNQGLLFANGFLYFQDGDVGATGSWGTVIKRMPYTSGQRKPTPATQVADITYYSSSLHWPKTMDLADDGTIYVGNGGDQGELCAEPHPFHGGVLALDPTGANLQGEQIAHGFRNPISIRCLHGHNTCFSLELAKDYTASSGGREKMVLIHKGDDWGFPCCATKGVPYDDSPSGTDCSGVMAETNSWTIGDTPFDLDFERGSWPAPWTGNAFVVTHGAAGSWTGARMVAIPMDASTGLPKPSTNTGGADMGMTDFATGWDDNSLSHGRPAAVAFHPDGRLFVANDNNGVIFWIAPID